MQTFIPMQRKLDDEEVSENASSLFNILTVIVTKHFVYVHTSRTAGTFLNKLILEHAPDAQMIQYHGHLRDLPREYAHLPVIGFVRNPWDWYVAMFFDYRRKQQCIFQIIARGGAPRF